MGRVRNLGEPAPGQLPHAQLASTKCRVTNLALASLWEVIIEIPVQGRSFIPGERAVRRPCYATQQRGIPHGND
jgi:hypothetical protein